MSFKQMYLGENILNTDFEIFVEAWSKYHFAADKIDGHLHYGLPSAAKAGREAMSNFLGYNPFTSLEGNEYKLWKTANLEALRRLGKCL